MSYVADGAPGKDIKFVGITPEDGIMDVAGMCLHTFKNCATRTR
jgi:hypothetical protein